MQFFPVDQFPEVILSTYTAGHHCNGSRQVGREKMGFSSAVLAALLRREITLSLADFSARNCERGVPFSSSSPHLWLQADGENVFGRSVVLDSFSLLGCLVMQLSPSNTIKECPELI